MQAPHGGRREISQNLPPSEQAKEQGMGEPEAMHGTDQQMLIYARELQELQAEQRRQVAELRDLYVALQAKEEMRDRLMAELLLAQETERKRVAADLHDGPLQDLGVLLLSVERCKRQLESG